VVRTLEQEPEVALQLTVIRGEDHVDVVVHDGEPPAGAPVVAGPALGILEALSVRAPLEVELPEEQAWMLGGLAAAFRQRV
jgi:hypothetical protein